MIKNFWFVIIFLVVLFHFGVSSCIKNPIREVCICNGEVCKVDSYNINFKKSEKIILKKDIKSKTIKRGGRGSGYIEYIEPVFSTPYQFVPFADLALDNIFDNYKSKTVKYNFDGLAKVFCSLFIILFLLFFGSDNQDKKSRVETDESKRNSKKRIRRKCWNFDFLPQYKL